MSESNNTTLPRSDAERKDYIAELFARINLPSDLALHLTKGRGGEVYYAILYHFDPKSDQKRTIKEEIVGNSPAEVMEEMIAFLEKNQLIPLTPQATDKGCCKNCLAGGASGYNPAGCTNANCSCHSPTEVEEWEKELTNLAIGFAGQRPQHAIYDMTELKSFIRTLLSQTLANERQRHERTLIALLPLAKGYIHDHDVGRNREMIAEAEVELERLEVYQQKIKSSNS